jgi:hypothetical protein
MVMQRDSKRVVFQDVMPVKKRLKPTVKKATRIQKVKIALLSLLKFPLYKNAKNKFANIPKKTRIIGFAIIAIAIISSVSYYLLTTHPTKIADNTQKTNIKPGLVRGTPEYSTVLPAGKNIIDLGGWTRVSPPSSDPVFAYTDKINNMPIIVSQQPLPASFKSDTAQQVKQLAQASNADEKITVGSITVYIGTSAKGPQSVFFSKNNLLILIKSNDQIENDQWAKYINSLQ